MHIKLKEIYLITRILTGVSIFLLAITTTANEYPCGHPSVPSNGKIQFSKNNTEVIYSCDDKYLLIGNSNRTCINGKWDLTPPICGVEVGYNKFSSNCNLEYVDSSQSASNVNDGNVNTSHILQICPDAVHRWVVNLENFYSIGAIQVQIPLTFQPQDDFKLWIIVLDISKESNVQNICQSSFKIIDNKYTIFCENPLHGNRVAVSSNYPLELNELEVFAINETESSLSRCDLDTFKFSFDINDKCYFWSKNTLFHWNEAQNMCQKIGGKIFIFKKEPISENILAYITQKQHNKVHDLTQSYDIWQNIEETETDFNNPSVCIALGRIRNDNSAWKLKAQSCNERAMFVCEYSIKYCDRPQIPEHSYIETESSRYPVFSNATYRCDSGFEIFGNMLRSCQENGLWSGTTPECKKLKDCDEPKIHNNSNIISQTDSFPSKMTYICDLGYALLGNSEIICKDGIWNGDPPECKKILSNSLSSDKSGIFIGIGVGAGAFVISTIIIILYKVYCRKSPVDHNDNSINQTSNYLNQSFSSDKDLPPLPPPPPPEYAYIEDFTTMENECEKVREENSSNLEAIYVNSPLKIDEESYYSCPRRPEAYYYNPNSESISESEQNLSCMIDNIVYDSNDDDDVSYKYEDSKL